MSTTTPPSDESIVSEQVAPRVPTLDDPQPATPVTASFAPGTADDPPVGTETAATVTVNGTAGQVPAGGTGGLALINI